MGIFRFVGRTLVATTFFGAGFALCAHTWPPSKDVDIRKMSERNKQTMALFNSVQKSPIFQKLMSDDKYKLVISSDLIPEAYRDNHVGMGLLNTPKHLQVGPLIFINEKDGEICSFSKLDSNLVGTDGKIHNGVIQTLMDEQLCFCGFPQLPLKRGVTAKLSVDYHGKAAPNSMVMLVAKVAQTHGRKCVIDGHVETFDASSQAPPKRIADAECILVQPKWFKYFNWVHIA